MYTTGCVQFDGVGKVFGRSQGGVAAIGNVSFSLARGTCLSLLGSNGSGKSTVLRIAGGLVRPDAGQIQVFGGDPCRDGRIRARIAALFEGGRALYGRLTPDENAHYFACLKGRDRHAAMARFAVLCERFAIERFRRMPVQTLSRGTQQKVATICALAGREELWLLDEPTLGLDKASCAILAELVNEHIRGYGAVLVATHDEAFAANVGAVVRMADFEDTQLVAHAGRDQPRMKPGRARPGRRTIFCCW
jgi:ABC-type multidrug transport system ATPase subunit